MFLAERKRAQPHGEATAEVGHVTLSGGEIAAYLEGEKRGLTLFAPGGYQWMPKTEETILVLKAGDRGETPCVVGTQTPPLPDLKPGQVRLSAQEGGAIRLGTGVEMTGKVTVAGSQTVTDNLAVGGTVTVGGVPLQKMIEDIVAKAVVK